MDSIHPDHLSTQCDINVKVLRRTFAIRLLIQQLLNRYYLSLQELYSLVWTVICYQLDETESKDNRTCSNQPAVIYPYTLIIGIGVHCIPKQFKFLPGCQTAVICRETTQQLVPSSLDFASSSLPCSHKEVNVLDRWCHAEKFEKFASIFLHVYASSANSGLGVGIPARTYRL